MLNLRNFAPFLNQLAHDLNPLQADRTPLEQKRIYDEFRSQADRGAARQHCGAGERVFEAIADNRPTDRLADCFDTLECALIAANIGGGNILVDGSPLPGFFRWHSDGRATLVPPPEMDADTVPSQPEPNAEEEKLARASYGVKSCEIPRGKFTVDHIDQWLIWIDVAALDQDTLQQIGMALHHYLDGSNTGLRMWRDLCQRSAACEQAAREQEYRQFGSSARERSAINIVHDIAVSGLIKSLNAQMAWRKDSTNSSVYQLVDKQIISVSRGKLLDEYKNSPFPQLTNGTPKLANPIDIWQSHPDRRDAYGTCAENSPEVFIKRPEGGFLLNIFRGLAEPGDAGGCEHFKLFLFEVICSGRQEVLQWIWNWMAWIVQNPTRLPMSAIMLAGSQGTGKNLFYHYLAKAIGEENCYLTDTPEELFAKHNQLSQGKRLCCADEAYFEGDPRHRNEMKGKITNKDIIVNPKGVGQYVIRNMAAWVLLSNSEKSPENTSDGRRITYIRTSDKYIPMRGKEASDAYYSPIYAELDGKGPSSLLRELLDTDLGDFKPHPKLSTPEGQVAAKHGDLGDAEWFRDFVETGEFPIHVTPRSDGSYMAHQRDAKECALNFQRSRAKRANDQSAGVLFNKLGFEKAGKSLKFWLVPELVRVRKAWMDKITLTPDFLDNPAWEHDEWEFKQVGR